MSNTHTKCNFLPKIYIYCYFVPYAFPILLPIVTYILMVHKYTHRCTHKNGLCCCLRAVVTFELPPPCTHPFPPLRISFLFYVFSLTAIRLTFLFPQLLFTSSMMTSIPPVPRLYLSHFTFIYPFVFSPSLMYFPRFLSNITQKNLSSVTSIKAAAAGSWMCQYDARTCGLW